METWFVQPTFTGLAGGVKDFQDNLVPDSKGFSRKIWDDDWNMGLGTPLVLLHNPGPAARGTLDDEASVTSFTVLNGPTAPFVAGGRRAQEDLLKKKWAFQTQQLTYKIWPFFINPGEIWNQGLAKSSIEHLPVIMKAQARTAQWRASLTQEGLHGLWERPGWIPSGRYGDEKCRVLSEVQRHFLEPVIDGGVSWQLWSQEEVHKALELRIYRFLLETGIIRKEAYRDAGLGSTEVDVPQDAIEIRRVEFEYADRRKKPRGLFRIDTQQSDSGIVSWDDSTGEPHSYIEDPMVNSMTIRMVPPPDAGGIAGIRYVPYPILNIQVLCEPLPIPRMFTWAIKWGLIADLLKKEGEAHDPVRAEKAELIYRLGVDLAKHLLGAKA